MLSDRPNRKEGVQARKLGEEWLLLDTLTGAAHVVNATAGRVWALCDGDHTLGDIERALRETSTVPPATDVRRDVEAVIVSFGECGILGPSA